MKRAVIIEFNDHLPTIVLSEGGAVQAKDYLDEVLRLSGNEEIINYLDVDDLDDSILKTQDRLDKLTKTKEMFDRNPELAKFASEHLIYTPRRMMQTRTITNIQNVDEYEANANIPLKVVDGNLVIA